MAPPWPARTTRVSPLRRLFAGRRSLQPTTRRASAADLVVVGLGNPGAQFEGTRHNVGATAVHALSRRHGTGRLRPVKGQQYLAEEVRIEGHRILLVVPTTYMNESGNAVGSLVRRHGVDDLERLVIIHDELDLAPGGLQVKVGGGLAGHNGLRSICAHLHAQGFVRIRIGIGKPPAEGAEHVLRRPGRAERQLLDEATERAADAVELIATAGTAAAMNRFNARIARQ